MSTKWTELLEAHADSEQFQLDAQKVVLERYQRPVYRYLLGALRSPESADEAFQEFALNFLQGAFRHADQKRGRFRDYLKTSLMHLVSGYRKKMQSRNLSLGEEVPEPAIAVEQDCVAEQEFKMSWRQELLDRTWSALADVERQTGQPFYAVLRFRTENPGLPSKPMAEELTTKLNPNAPFTDTGIRKTLQRAREWFADLLLDEVAHSMANPARQQLEEELIELGLLEYCREALQRR